MADDYYQKVTDKEGELKDLFSRMDGDKDLLYLKKYVMKDLQGRRVPGIVELTLNKPAVFDTNVETSLAKSTEQITVETDDKKIDQAYIEDFVKAAVRSANSLLLKKGMFKLNAFFDHQMCIRGRGGARCLFRMDEGKLIPEIVPLDTRYMTYEMGVDGLKWAAYKITTSKEDIETAQWARDKKIAITGKTAVLLDVWDKEHNEIWIDGKKRFEQEHDYGYTPVAIQLVPLGSMLLDKDSVSHWGESIFFLIRDLIPELNMIVSMLKTLTLAAVKAPKQFASAEGTRAQLPEGSDELGAMTAIDIGGGISLVPLADIKRAAMYCLSEITKAIQEGSLSSIDLGTLEFPLSAVALVELGEGRDQVFLPRLGSRGLLNQQLAEMLIDQVIGTGEGSVELGPKGHRRSFDISKLEGEYEVIYKYFLKSPMVDIGRFSAAGVAERYLDKRTILSDVIQVEDPDGVMEKRYYDIAEEISPMVLRRRVVKSLIKQDEDEEARLMMAEAGITLEGIMEGHFPETAPIKEPTPAEPVLPLLGEGRQVGGMTSAKRAAELKATPREEEGGEE